jgi:hypothetical protein
VRKRGTVRAQQGEDEHPGTDGQQAADQLCAAEQSPPPRIRDGFAQHVEPGNGGQGVASKEEELDPVKEDKRQRRLTVEPQRQRCGVEQIERAAENGSPNKVGLFAAFVRQQVSKDKLRKQPSPIYHRREQADGHLAVGQPPHKVRQDRCGAGKI